VGYLYTLTVDDLPSDSTPGTKFCPVDLFSFDQLPAMLITSKCADDEF